MSDSTDWQRAKELFEAALARPAELRSAFLDESCPDPSLRAEVETLLAAHARAGDFLEEPVATLPTLAAGTRLGPYAISALISSGGMGDVYRGYDSRLSREVAIKVLPADVAEEPARRRRFEQEARAASALSHPNIVTVHDTGVHAGLPYIVTELLLGQPLDERVAQGAIPVRKALEYAVQVARGLAAAHAHGVVHRDLKPANLFLCSDGMLKILDFGIAKLGLPDPRAPGPRAAPGTVPGLVLGTVGYMSPEQVRGETVDARSDQFSLGCVLYELLGGRPPFQRATIAQTLAAVIEDEPEPLAEASPRVPRVVAWIVERCLAKDPADRYHSTHDLTRDLELAVLRFSELALPAVALPSRIAMPRVAFLAMATAVATAAGALGWWLGREPAGVPAVRYLTYSGRDSSPAASPDGRTLAFSSSRDGRQRIWLKQLVTGNEAPLTAGEDDHPRFSPDGSTVLFARRDGGRVSLYRVPTVGGEPTKVVDDALYGDYSRDGRIAFVRQSADGTGIKSLIATTDADGSHVRELASIDGTGLPGGAFVHPRWSPDGRALLATESPLQLGAPTVMALLDAQTGAARLLPAPREGGVWPGGVAWIGPEQILLMQPESVVGQQGRTSSRVAIMDLGSGAVRPLLSSPFNLLGVDVLGAGRLVLATRWLRQNLREIPLRGSHGTHERWLTHGNGTDRQPVYSPDGEWVAFSSNRAGNLDIWAVSRSSGAVRRLTDDPADDADPGFTPDGRLLWSSNRSGHFEVWIAEPDGTGKRQVTRDGVDAENPVATPDGQWVVYASANPRSRGVMKIRTDGSEPTPVARGNLILPEVSPDGRHVAFAADLGTERPTLRVVRMADGAPAPFEIPLPPWSAGGTIDQGRSRWLPDGSALAHIVGESDGSYSVYVQDFVPGVDTSHSRRRVAGFEPGLDAESLGVSADGALLTVSFREQLFDLMIAEGVPGVDRPRSR